MNCPRCGKPVVNGAAFCMHCGNQISARVATQQPNPTIPPQPTRAVTGAPVDLSTVQAAEQKKKTMAAIGIGTLLALLAIGFGLRSLLTVRGEGAVPNVQARGTLNIPDVHVQSPAPAPTVTQAAPPPAEHIRMPDDVYQWLEHLRKTEEARVGLITGQVADAATEHAKQSVTGGVDALKSLLDGAENPDAPEKSPTEGLVKMFQKMRGDCQTLAQSFDAYPAPDECKPIQGAYDQAIHETYLEIDDIATSLQNNDLKALYAMVGKSKKTIDSPGKKTDDMVQQICDKYETKKWFSINGDIASAGGLTLPGF